jgi:hypothetical protein
MGRETETKGDKEMRLKGIAAMMLVGTMAVAGVDCWGQEVLVKGGLPGLVFNVAKTGRTALGDIKNGNDWTYVNNTYTVDFGPITVLYPIITFNSVGTAQTKAMFKKKEIEIPEWFYSGRIFIIEHFVKFSHYRQSGGNRPKTTVTVGIFAKGPLWNTATASIDSASGQVPIALNRRVIKTIVGLVTPTISSNYLTSSISLTPPKVQ